MVFLQKQITMFLKKLNALKEQGSEDKIHHDQNINPIDRRLKTLWILLTV